MVSAGGHTGVTTGKQTLGEPVEGAAPPGPEGDRQTDVCRSPRTVVGALEPQFAGGKPVALLSPVTCPVLPPSMRGACRKGVSTLGSGGSAHPRFRRFLREHRQALGNRQWPRASPSELRMHLSSTRGHQLG